MFGRIPRQRLGAMVSHAKTLAGNVDRGLRTASTVFRATNHLVPDGKLKSAAEKGLSDYESIREKIRSAAPPM